MLRHDQLMESRASFPVVEGVHECGQGFVVLDEALSRNYRTVIAGYDVTLTLPRSDTDWDLLPPEWTCAPPRSIRDYGHPHGPWGNVIQRKKSTDGSYVPIAAQVRAFRFASEVAIQPPADRRAVAQAINDGLDGWWAIATSWIEIMTQQDITRLGRDETSAMLGQDRQIWTSGDDGETASIALNPRALEAGFTTELPKLTFELLQRCVNLAGRGVEAPLEWLLVRDARSLLNAGEMRRAVLDAGTAAELAMTRLIDLPLATTPQSVRKALLSKYRMLGPLSNLLRELGDPLPADFVAKLVTPRNTATHKGIHPTRGEAVGAIEMAAEIVEKAIPLSGFS